MEPICTREQSLHVVAMAVDDNEAPHMIGGHVHRLVHHM